tara:strand:+ start:3765 stop:5030 length:1266 start_codon:yes stop_codon:yes gene_type:complete
MATLTGGDTLSLNNLKTATGAGAASISSAMGSTPSAGANISFSSFAIDTVGSISGYTYLPENNSDTYTLGFTGEGANFTTRIKTVSTNFTWSVASGTTITKQDGDYNITVSSGQQTADGSQTVRQANATNTLRVVFSDSYNDHITSGAGYGANKDKTIYVVDTYDGNSTPLCLSLDTPITKADGTTIQAGDIQEGDVLKGFQINGLDEDSDSNYLQWNSDALSKTAENVTVTNVVFSFAIRTYNINNGELVVTGEHPMLIKDVDDTFKFKPALSIEVGDSLIKEDSSEVKVTSITPADGDVEVVSIDVETQDTYLINGYITHNKGANSHTAYVPAQVTGLSYSDPNLTWTNVTDFEDYKVQISTVSNFSSTTHDYSNWSSAGIEIGDSFFGLTQGNTYYARIAGRDAGILGTYSSTLTFVL